VRMSSALLSGFGFSRLRMDFRYDYQGRRIEKRVVNMDTSAETLARRFLYDGWNLVAEIDANTPATILRSYAWGLDLVGDPTKSGGVGALLRVTNYTGGVPGTSYLPAYDANGNVLALLNATSGATASIYEYDSYGNLIRNEVADAAIADSPFRFSTKYSDIETGLLYYGHRYYSPWLGRFICRDPKEEDGGRNLYAFLHNNAINHVDLLGWHSMDDSNAWDNRGGGSGGSSGGASALGWGWSSSASRNAWANANVGLGASSPSIGELAAGARLGRSPARDWWPGFDLSGCRPHRC